MGVYSLDSPRRSTGKATFGFWKHGRPSLHRALSDDWTEATPVSPRLIQSKRDHATPTVQRYLVCSTLYQYGLFDNVAMNSVVEKVYLGRRLRIGNGGGRYNVGSI